MHISDEALNEFIAIYNDKFGEELSHKDAAEMASRVLKLYEMLARKLPNETTSPPKPRGEIDDARSKIGFRT